MDYKNILIVRTDRIGDVVLTLPLVQVLRRAYPDARISFLVRSYTKDIVAGQPGLNNVLLYDEDGKAKGFFGILFELRRSHFDLAFVAFPRFRIALLLILAGVPTRVGTGYRWYSCLFNKRLFEHRKTSVKHEYEYNLSLAKKIGCSVDEGDLPRLTVGAASKTAAAEELRRLGLSKKDRIAILHPGSGGSARDWRPENFGRLAQRLTDLGWRIVVTGAAGEERLVENVVRGSGRAIATSVGRLSLSAVAAFISTAKLFASNSTGPLHIASAVGTPVIGFYPPILACSPDRWGPVTEKKMVFVPDKTECPLCKGGECRGNICMDLIGVDEVVSAAEKLGGATVFRQKSIEAVTHP